MGEENSRDITGITVRYSDGSSRQSHNSSVAARLTQEERKILTE